jgi:hypothetical protein
VSWEPCFERCGLGHSANDCEGSEATRQAAPLDHDDRADSRSDLPDIRGHSQTQVNELNPVILRALCVANRAPQNCTHAFSAKKGMVKW